MSVGSGETMGSNGFSELVSRLRLMSSLDDQEIFGVQVPLRICPLGAHIDHQGGRVTGMAVDRSVTIAAAPVEGPLFTAESMDYPGAVVVDVSVEPISARRHWGDYVRAAVSALRSRYPLDRGLSAVVRGDLAEAGLSSSAAVLLAYLVSLARVNDIDLGPEEIAALVQRAENSYVGVASGLLDQSVMIHADRGKLTVIDCLDSTISQIDVLEPSESIAVVVAFSGAARTLVDSGFNNRVAECGEAARRLLAFSGHEGNEFSRLRDVSPEVFAENESRLPSNLRLRATHYFTEMARVAAGVSAWGRGDFIKFGELMTASGTSSIINYECGTPSLTTLFELLRNEEGILGARFSGGGFGGTCIALAVPKACDQIISSVSARYAEQWPELAPSSLFEVCSPAGPMRIIENPL